MYSREIHQPNVILNPYPVFNPLNNLKIAAIGGGTGLPSVLRAVKPYTREISAIVTVADDGGSSGRLRREYDMLPPGDMRNNIVALADDEHIIAKLFQHRFEEGELAGHTFGNIFLTALSQISDNSMLAALSEIKNLLHLRGQVIPATLSKVNLAANIRLADGRKTYVTGESCISASNGTIEKLYLLPDRVKACPEAVQAIRQAELIILGPGSLFTSVLPNLLIPEIRDAICSAKARKVYICNIVTQPGETDHFDLSNHIRAIEDYVGEGVLEAVLANDCTARLPLRPGVNYVLPMSSVAGVLDRYQMLYGDMVDEQKPWSHHNQKLAHLLTQFLASTTRDCKLQ